MEYKDVSLLSRIGKKSFQYVSAPVRGLLYVYELAEYCSSELERMLTEEASRIEVE